MRILLISMLMLFTAGCSTSFTEVKQIDDKAFIQLTGQVSQGTLIIDGTQIDLASAEKFKLDGVTVSKFELSSGTHLIEVIRDGKTVVKRKIYVTNGNVFEVNVP